ncbi:MAG: hypothetical protein NTW11_00360 [Candidatus Staskawiczbacteria bacterium]|nr:hypothetical protein [Candidatus Staskawiczbacteria bacterium]
MDKTTSLVLPVTLSELTKFLAFLALSILSFFVPFAFGQPQWLVGTIVNACLFLSAIYLPKKYYIPLIILPSLGVLARGAVFGPFTFFIIYFLPFIWLANLLLVLVFKKAISLGIFSVAISAFAKFLFLIAIANIYFSFNLAPKLFLQTMGLNQLITALAGGLIAFIIFKIYGQFNARS